MSSYVLEWYENVFTRVVDLVGDYAGKELFLVEGDSLLLKSFEDKRLDFDDGFQLLHAVYIVESELERLVQRKCNFHVIFFDDHADLCVPSSAAEHSRSRYLLARSAIIQHLKLRLSSSGSVVTVRQFPKYDCEDFRNYLGATGIYFVMCHDGSSTQHSNEIEALTAAEHKTAQAFRSFIFWLMLLGFNVALINEVEWRDSKVFARVIEGDRHQQRRVGHDAYRSAPTGTVYLNGSKLSKEDLTPLPAIIEKAPNDFSERDYLSIFTLSKMLDQGSANAHLASALLLHLSCLRHLSLAQRRVQSVQLSGQEHETHLKKFITDFSTVAKDVLNDPSWNNLMREYEIECDIQDVIDGRLLRAILCLLDKNSLTSVEGGPILEDFEQLARTLHSLHTVKLSLDAIATSEGKPLHGVDADAVSNGVAKDAGILPFSNPVFDKHLASIHIMVDEAASTSFQKPMPIISREISHWHNAKRSLDPKKATAVDPTKKVSKWWNPSRSNQFYMRDMTTYSASLTNTKGKTLTPETITLSTGKVSASAAGGKEQKGKKDLTGNEQKGKQIAGAKETKGKKETSAGGSKADKIVAENKAKKDKVESTRTLAAWDTVRRPLDKLDPESRFLEASAYLHRLEPSKTGILQLEVEMYCLQALLQRWAIYCRDGHKDEGYRIGALIWDILRRLGPTRTDMTKAATSHLQKVCSLIGLPQPEPPSRLLDRPLSFDFVYPLAGAKVLSLDLSPREFQLLHCGPYMDRNTDARPDPRVSSFQPDGWQRKVLDELDANHSIFVVAPTSAGKTFISFYAMEKVLRESNDGVLVYVAPTKALVNQIAAEILGRFSKNYPHAGTSVWAIHTRDYRINNPSGCQILVTVPHILQIMLLAPSNARSWAPRVKRIIFDEIHSIGQAEDGVVWEQLLLLAPCQIIALSATVGNPEEFNDWLASAQKSLGMTLTMIKHDQRYSDLRKSVYTPPKQISFKGLKEVGPSTGSHGLDNTSNLKYFHPVASLVNKSRGLPDDLTLEGRDCLYLWKSMTKHQNKEFMVPKALDPEVALPPLIKKVDVFAWEAKLKEILKQWMETSNSPFDKVLDELSSNLHEPTNQEAKGLGTPSGVSSPIDGSTGSTTGSTASSLESVEIIDPQSLTATTLPLLVRLHERNALPAIFFNYDRGQCERIARSVLTRLEKAEQRHKDTSPEWKKLVQGFEEWKKVQEAKNARKGPKVPDKKKKKGNDGSDDDDGPLSKADAVKDSASEEKNFFESFDPMEPLEKFSFANKKRYEAVLLKHDLRQLERKGLPTWLGEALKRGIGIHHAGMNRKYRTIVEILFRRGFLRVVIATGTLALGINMPCTTVVFSGDSIFLTALNFRQAAGRAGRRGFDLLGNVVFQGIAMDKVCRLLSSRLPDLNGHFPITTTLVLRLFTLLHGSNSSSYATAAINSLLSQPRLYLGGDSFREQVLHHLRFSIEYLRKQELLGFKGEPINFADCVSHLYYTENSSFAFHALLRGGYFQDLCSNQDLIEEERIRVLMSVMANIFGRRNCRNVQQEFIDTIIKRSPSIVFLPPMPEEATKILRDHNKQTLAVFTSYVETFAAQHLKEDERQLPLTRTKAGGEGNNEAANTLGVYPPTKSRSAFVALSGLGDKFESISDLCSTARSGVFLEEAVVPHLRVHPEETESPLNAYLYDFFRHGALDPLEKANGIRKSDVWFMLNDFSLVLATIVTSLANFLHLKTEQDDMTDIVGGGDALEIDADEKMAEEQQLNPMPQVGQVKAKPVVVKAKTKVVDSWDDDAGAEEEQSEGDEDGDERDGGGQSSEELKLYKVYQTFCKLRALFDEKLKAIGA